MPLAEFRLLSLVATMLAESWAIGYEARDKLLVGAVSRMMFFVEQTALDSSVGLAFVRISRASESHDDDLSKEARLGAFCSTLPCAMDLSKPVIPPGFRLA